MILSAAVVVRCGVVGWLLNSLGSVGVCLEGKTGVVGENASLARRGEGHPILVCVCLYLCTFEGRTLMSGRTGLQQIWKEVCSISGIAPLTDTITCPGALYLRRGAHASFCDALQ